MLDLVCLAVVVLFVLRGWRRGLLLTALALGGIAAAYAAAYGLHAAAGRLVAGLFDLQPLLAYPLGGAIVFASVLLLVGLLGAAVRRQRDRQRRRGEGLPLAGHLAGGLLGGAYGVALVVVGLASLLFVQGMAQRSWLDVRGSASGKLALPLWERLLRGVAHRASGSERLARAAERLAHEPDAVARGLERVAADERMQRLVHSLAPLRPAVSAGGDSAEELIAQLARDRTFVDAASDVGLVNAADKAKPAQVEQQLAEQLIPLASSIGALAADPEVQRLVAEPELQAKLQRRDLLELVNDPQFNQLATRILKQLRSARNPRASGSTAPGPADGTAERAQGRGEGRGQGQAPTPQSEQTGSSGRVYKWTDKHGRAHFSDTPPPGIDYETIEMP